MLSLSHAASQKLSCDLNPSPASEPELQSSVLLLL